MDVTHAVIIPLADWEAQQATMRALEQQVERLKTEERGSMLRTMEAGILTSDGSDIIAALLLTAARDDGDPLEGPDWHYEVSLPTEIIDRVNANRYEAYRRFDPNFMRHSIGIQKKGAGR